MPLGPGPEAVRDATRDFATRARRRQIQPGNHMLAEGIYGPETRVVADDVPAIVSVPLVTAVGSAVLRSLREVLE